MAEVCIESHKPIGINEMGNIIAVTPEDLEIMVRGTEIWHIPYRCLNPEDMTFNKEGLKLILKNRLSIDHYIGNYFMAVSTFGREGMMYLYGLMQDDLSKIDTPTPEEWEDFKRMLFRQGKWQTSFARYNEIKDLLHKKETRADKQLADRLFTELDAMLENPPHPEPFDYGLYIKGMTHILNGKGDMDLRIVIGLSSKQEEGS